MNKINIYLFKITCQAIIRTTIGLISIAMFLKLLEEQGDVQGNYSIFLSLYHTILLTPALLYQMFPACCLIGSVLGLSNLTKHQELVILQSSGLSKFKIIKPVILAVLTQIIIVTLIGELIAPKALEKAKLIKFTSKSSSTFVNTQQGIWIKSQNNFIHIDNIASQNHLQNINIYTIENNKLKKIGFALDAVYLNHSWKLKNYQESIINPNNISIKKYPELIWPEFLNPNLIKILNADPNELSMKNLASIIQYSQKNFLSYENYSLTFWGKIFTPSITICMVLFAIPFVFGNLRSINLSLRIFIAILTGLSYFLVVHLSANLILIFNINPFISTVLPILLFGLLGIGLILMQFSRR